MASYFNAYPAGLEGLKHDKYITVPLAPAVLEDISAHFLLIRRPWTRNRRMCIMVQLER